jgi:hypothetical protein
MVQASGVNGDITRTLKTRTIYLAILLIFSIGAISGFAYSGVRFSCQQLAAEQRRTVALFSTLAETSKRDGAEESSIALEAFANQAAKIDHPRC